MFRPRRHFAGVATVVLAGLGAFSVAPPATAAVVPWAPAASAAIHPGVQTHTAGTGQCTANFVFTDGVRVYIGQAAHCSGTGGSTATNGCDSPSAPLGTRVTVDGASMPGTMVYNSWLTMQALGETDSETCQYNDLAIVELNQADRAKVNPSIPRWGGPVAASSPGTATGDNVYSYGNSSLRLGISLLSPKQGVSLGDSPGGWSHDVVTVTPGIPGDSGSAFLDESGNALGILSTVQVAPTAGTNGVGDLGREVAYMHAHSAFTNVNLALGTQPFTP